MVFFFLSFMVDLFSFRSLTCLAIFLSSVRYGLDSFKQRELNYTLLTPLHFLHCHIVFANKSFDISYRLNIFWRPIIFRVYLLQEDGGALGRNDLIVINGVAWRGLGDPCPSLFSCSLTMNWEDYARSHTTGIWLCYSTKLASSIYDRLDPPKLWTNQTFLYLLVDYLKCLYRWIFLYLLLYSSFSSLFDLKSGNIDFSDFFFKAIPGIFMWTICIYMSFILILSVL